MKKLNIISSSSDEFCCGAMCPRQEVQIRIDRMQRAIDTAYEHLCFGGLPNQTLQELKEELTKLNSTE